MMCEDMQGYAPLSVYRNQRYGLNALRTEKLEILRKLISCEGFVGVCILRRFVYLEEWRSFIFGGLFLLPLIPSSAYLLLTRTIHPPASYP